jgi:hypothetical protein
VGRERKAYKVMMYFILRMDGWRKSQVRLYYVAGNMAREWTWDLGRWGSRVEGGVSSQYLELESEVGHLNLFIASVEVSSGER